MQAGRREAAPHDRALSVAGLRRPSPYTGPHAWGGAGGETRCDTAVPKSAGQRVAEGWPRSCDLHWCVSDGCTSELVGGAGWAGRRVGVTRLADIVVYAVSYHRRQVALARAVGGLVLGNGSGVWPRGVRSVEPRGPSSRRRVHRSRFWLDRGGLSARRCEMPHRGRGGSSVVTRLRDVALARCVSRHGLWPGAWPRDRTLTGIGDVAGRRVRDDLGPRHDPAASAGFGATLGVRPARCTGV